MAVGLLRQSCLYDAPQFFRRDRLLDNGSIVFIESRSCAKPNRVASNEDQSFRQGRPFALQPAQQRRPIEIRHPDVAQNDIVGVASELGERMLAVKRDLDRKPLALQHFGEQLGKIALVVDDQSAAPGVLGNRLAWCWRMRRLASHDRQSDLERRAAARCLVDLDRAAMSANKSMADRQTDTRSAANGLGCEERLEHPRAQVWLDAGSIVTDDEPELRVRRLVTRAHTQSTRLRYVL